MEVVKWKCQNKFYVCANDSQQDNNRENLIILKHV